MLYTFIVSIGIPNCKSIVHFSSPKWGVLYLQKHTNYDVRFQSRFLLFLGFLRKNQMAPLDSWGKTGPDAGATACANSALPPSCFNNTAAILSVQRSSLWCIVGRVVMHCGSQRMPRPARDRALQRLGGIKRVSRSRIGASWHLEKRCSGSQLIGECDGDKIKEGSWRT